MKKQQQSKSQEQMQLSFSFNSFNKCSNTKITKIVQLKDFQKKSVIGYVLRNSKSF